MQIVIDELMQILEIVDIRYFAVALFIFMGGVLLWRMK